MFFIDEEKINEVLTAPAVETERVRDIIALAREAGGLSLEQAAALLRCTDPERMAEMFTAAREIKERIYGKRLVVFAPLYLSNRCVNNCLYCGFRRDNTALVRHTLTREEAAEEALMLVRQGQKRLLLVCGEYGGPEAVEAVCEIIGDLYAVREGNGEIRRINVNMAPLDAEGFRRLREARIGTFQAFQETYHLETYRRMHPSGPKADYGWRLHTMDRAFEGGIDDVGMGVLFGLYDPRFEVLALLQHVAHLEETFGVGCHTISVPRLEPALNAPAANHPPFAVVDSEFKKIVAVLRLAVPWTGIILSTRESAALRREVIALGVSQISAGSRTFPGAYRGAESGRPAEEQFHIGDCRPLDHVIRDIAADGYLPSFCTACYRLGRTGEHFMEFAKPGEIHRFCDPNAILTTVEYLLDYASNETARVVWPLIERKTDELPEVMRTRVREHMARIRGGERDLYL
ncbi:MAG: [FeFe] hydrogenase H-cluster radical SAM maturase HydG [Acidobacteria bacterium]|nr:[FeFe] hydrogenase H-cluster radical SAM maturase HydG [Acidobacteriota bacterium]